MRQSFDASMAVATGFRRHLINKHISISINPSSLHPRQYCAMVPPTATNVNVSHFHQPFISALDSAAPINAQDDPNYYARYPRSLITTSNLDTFVALDLRSTNH
jgi:hypothetical protein